MNYLYSVVLELHAVNAATISATMGHQAHALFLNLIKQVDPVLSARLHEEPGYRPFTVSSLDGVRTQDNSISLQPGQACRLRVTLVDGGQLWQCLSMHFLEARSMTLRLGEAELQLNRMLSTPSADPTGWAGFTDWQTLAFTPARHTITMRFASPTAFSLGDRRFAFFPEPILLWDSLMRVWNTYAPEVLHVDKPALRDFIPQNVTVTDYTLHTSTLHYPRYVQKGFVGTCNYLIQSREHAAQLTALAEFARYSGVGYKTTMGMGQARAEYTVAEQ